MLILWYVWIIDKFYALVSLCFGCIMCLMIVSYTLGNFMWWELRFSWVWELGYDWGISLYIRKNLLVISFGFSFRWREREYGHLSSSCTNLSRLLFSGKWYVTCVFDKYKNCLEYYYALKLLIRDITYKHDLSKIYVCELFNLIYMIISAYWC